MLGTAFSGLAAADPVLMQHCVHEEILVPTQLAQASIQWVMPLRVNKQPGCMYWVRKWSPSGGV
eukprot:914863-Alexandrium_andersonii.AAC.1